LHKRRIYKNGPVKRKKFDVSERLEAFLLFLKLRLVKISPATYAKQIGWLEDGFVGSEGMSRGDEIFP